MRKSRDKGMGTVVSKVKAMFPSYQKNLDPETVRAFKGHKENISSGDQVSMETKLGLEEGSTTNELQLQLFVKQNERNTHAWLIFHPSPLLTRTVNQFIYMHSMHTSWTGQYTYIMDGSVCIHRGRVSMHTSWTGQYAYIMDGYIQREVHVTFHLCSAV